jgi:hypothetical protein
MVCLPHQGVWADLITGTDEGTGAHDVSLAYRLVELQDCLCVWHEGGCEWSRESLQLWQLT